MRTCYTRHGCSKCDDHGRSRDIDLWINEDHIFLQVDRVYFVNERGVELDHPNAADPAVKAASVGFRGWVVEPGETKCNMWQFWIKSKNDVMGRPCGASVSSYRPPNAPMNQYGYPKRRAKGEWYEADWVPQEAIEDCINLMVK